MATKTSRPNISTELMRVALLALLIIYPGLAWAQAPFYQGKTITIVQGRDPGGTGDMRVRALMPFLQKYIPGNPTIVNEYMPGGGSRKAANHVYKSVASRWPHDRKPGARHGFFCSAWRAGSHCTISINLFI